MANQVCPSEISALLGPKEPQSFEGLRMAYFWKCTAGELRPTSLLKEIWRLSSGGYISWWHLDEEGYLGAGTKDSEGYKGMEGRESRFVLGQNSLTKPIYYPHNVMRSLKACTFAIAQGNLD